MGSFKHLHEADNSLITEALNTAPYELQMVKKGTDVQFLFKDDEFQVRFRNAPKLGSNVRRVTIRQKQGNTYKDVLKGLGSDTNKVLSTVIAAVEAYAKTPMGKSTDGLVVDFSKKAIGRGAKLIQAVLKRNKTIKKYFTAVDAAVATDAAMVSHWLVGKGKDATEVFNGSDVVGLIGDGEISDTPPTPEFDPERPSTHLAIYEELKPKIEALGHSASAIMSGLMGGYYGTDINYEISIIEGRVKIGKRQAKIKDFSVEGLLQTFIILSEKYDRLNQGDPEIELKKAMDALGATKLRHGYKGQINGLTFIMSKKTNGVDVFKAEDGVESGTTVQLPTTSDSDLIIGAIEDASSAHKAKLNIESGNTLRGRYETYIEEEMGEDPVWKGSDKRIEFDFEDDDGDMLSVAITFSEDETEVEDITVGWDGDELYVKRNPRGDIDYVIKQALDIGYSAKETDEDLGDDSDREGLISAIADLEIDTGVSGWDDVDYAGFAMQATHIASGLVLTIFYTDDGEIGMNVKDPSSGEDVEDEVVDQDDVLDLMDDLGWDGEWDDEGADARIQQVRDGLSSRGWDVKAGDSDNELYIERKLITGMVAWIEFKDSGIVLNNGRVDGDQQLYAVARGETVQDKQLDNMSDVINIFVNKYEQTQASFDYSQNGAYSIKGTVESVVHYLLRNTRKGGLLDRSDVTNFDGRLVDERGQTVANVFKSTNPERGYSFIEVRVGGNSTGELEIVNGAVDMSEIGEWFDANVQRVLGESAKSKPSFASFLKEKQS
ncbi:hypothetical protein GR28A_00082 [Vibrio phage vB_VcorM_GR28A]|nr:hypothetical protein GR28A_00082 [Vibrio phage vB_VcorM_GR28A]